MSTPVKSSPLSRPQGQAALGRGPGFAPLPPKGGRSRSLLVWLLLIPLLLLSLTYLLGRTVEPVRAKLVRIPLAGKLLFGADVWTKAGTTEPVSTQPTTPSSATKAPAAPANPAVTELQKLADEAAARLAVAEVKENDLKAREAAVQNREAELAKEQAKLSVALQETQALQVELQGQVRTEKGRLEVVRAMSRTAQTSFVNALTDDEALVILKYMTPEEISRILEKLDPYRAARLYQRLPITAP